MKHSSKVDISTEWTPSLWLNTFEELLCDDKQLDYGDRWTLKVNYSQTDIITMEARKKGWKVYSHSAFGNFQCTYCKKTWASQVVVLFRYRLLNGQGMVIMRPFGQACYRCKDDKLPGFAKKEVEQALLRQFFKIRKNCYGEEDDKISGGSSSESKVRTKPQTT